MKIKYSHTWCKLLEYTKSEMAWLDDYTSVEVRVYRPGQWGKIEDRYRMLDYISKQFPSGFVSMLCKAAQRDGVNFEITNLEALEPVVKPDLSADISWLRDYQHEAVLACCKHQRGLIKAPTGSGKGELIIALTRIIPCEWLFVVHRADLVEQTARRYQLRTGEQAGIWSAQRGWRRGTCNITVATFQSIWSAYRKRDQRVHELLDSVQGLLVDECHAQAATSFTNVSMLLSNASYRLGFSGTPLNKSDKDNIRIIGVLGPIIHRVRTETLIDAGILSKPTIYMAPCPQKTSTDSSWADTYRDMIVRSITRNKLVIDMVKQAKKPALVFVEEIEHGEILQELLRLQGIRSDFANGDDHTSVRQHKIRKLVDEGHYDVLICSVVFQEGIDIPELASVVNAAGKKSIVAALQRIGRGMRTAAGKTTFEVYDVLDRGQRWLSDHANQRMNAYQKEGHQILVGWPPTTASSVSVSNFP